MFVLNSNFLWLGFYYVTKDEHFLKINQSVNGIVQNQLFGLMKKKQPQNYSIFKSPKGDYLEDSFGTNSRMQLLRVLWFSCFHQA